MAFLTNLTAALNGAKLEDLTDRRPEPPEVIPVDPTPAMILQVIDKLRDGVVFREIQQTVLHQNRVLTIDQIKEINRARLAKIASLQADEEPVVPEG
jgi:hypothetical protein